MTDTQILLIRRLVDSMRRLQAPSVHHCLSCADKTAALNLADALSIVAASGEETLDYWGLEDSQKAFERLATIIREEYYL